MLPGIRFDPQARALGQAMPRMDVAGFVGFAAMGPLHLPVALDEADAYARVFGTSPLLARERGSGRPLRGLLAGAVRAFFDNGGRRCWVVRVAGPSARANRWRLLGWRSTVRADAGWQLGGDVVAAARSPGSWSDTLNVRATPRLRPATAAGITRAGAGVTLTLSASPPPLAGDLLCLDSGQGTACAWLPLARVTVRDDGSVVAGCDRGLQLSATGSVEGDADAARLAAQTRARIASLDLEVTDRRDGSVRRLENLGLVRGHPRDWRALAGDAALYGSGAGSVPADARPFPLAGLAAAAGSFELPDVTEPQDASAVLPDDLTALERDGLASFDAGLFLDPGLAGASRQTLLALADELRYTGARPRPLSGLHALLGDSGSTVQDEVTLIAVPDALHRPWHEVPGSASGPDISEITPVPRSPATPPHAQPSFATCHPLRPATPAWGLAYCGYRNGALEVFWHGVPEQDGLVFRLEAAPTPDFALPDTVQCLKLASASLRGTPGAERYLRVRAERAGVAGNWSNPLRVRVPAMPQVEIDPAAATPALVPVQAAMLRLAAARGDWLALLALPPDWREDQALAHARRLQALDADAVAPSTGSFGALFHPWAMVTDAEAGLVALPPDALAAALLARRALERGAWVAPANETLRGVVALTPPLLPARWEALEEGRVNVLRREPAGFVTLSEQTLAAEPEGMPLHARRLLSLLRRLVLQLGAEFVFEPNDLALRVSLQTRCEHVLQRLLARGAFAGARPAEAFEVTVRAGSDEASLVVELRVRPAAALRFITVRLVQAGAGAAVTELP